MVGGLVDIHEDGDMSDRVKHETNNGYSMKDSTQVASKGMEKGVHESQ